MVSVCICVVLFRLMVAPAVVTSTMPLLLMGLAPERFSVLPLKESVQLEAIVTVPVALVVPPSVAPLVLLILRLLYVIALTVCEAPLPMYSTVRLVRVLLEMVYWERKSAVAAVR